MSLIDLEAEIAKIREDKVHGASWLSRAALDLLKALVEKLPSEDTYHLLGFLREVAKKLSNARPNMALLTNFIARFLYWRWNIRGDCFYVS